MGSGESLGVVSIKLEMECMLGGHSVEDCLQIVHASLGSHGFGGEVGVATSSVPIFEKFGCE